MEIIREGSSTFRPPILVGKNYSYCKPKMISFLKSLDGRAWRSVVVGWETLMVRVDGQFVLKLEIDWTEVEEQASMKSSKTLNAIFSGVDLHVFKLINPCSSAKEA